MLKRAGLHPNIIQMLDEFQLENDAEVFITELMSTDLYTYLNKLKASGKPGFDLFKLRDWMAQILTGLQHLHDIGMIHRDVKLDNVLIDIESDIVKLADFGIAILEGESDDGKSYCFNSCRPG